MPAWGPFLHPPSWSWRVNTPDQSACPQVWWNASFHVLFFFSEDHWCIYVVFSTISSPHLIDHIKAFSPYLEGLSPIVVPLGYFVLHDKQQHEQMWLVCLPVNMIHSVMWAYSYPNKIWSDRAVPYCVIYQIFWSFLPMINIHIVIPLYGWWSFLMTKRLFSKCTV